MAFGCLSLNYMKEMIEENTTKFTMEEVYPDFKIAMMNLIFKNWTKICNGESVSKSRVLDDIYFSSQIDVNIFGIDHEINTDRELVKNIVTAKFEKEYESAFRLEWADIDTITVTANKDSEEFKKIESSIDDIIDYEINRTYEQNIRKMLNVPILENVHKILAGQTVVFPTTQKLDAIIENTKVKVEGVIYDVLTEASLYRQHILEKFVGDTIPEIDIKWVPEDLVECTCKTPKKSHHNAECFRCELSSDGTSTGLFIVNAIK